MTASPTATSAILPRDRPVSSVFRAWWRPTAALVRAVLLTVAGLGVGLLLGGPVTVVLAAPFAVWTFCALRHRPGSEPFLSVALDHPTLHEGQGTTSRIRLSDPTDVEYVARLLTPAPYVAFQPESGAVGGLLPGPLPAVGVSPRRWGRRQVDVELAALTSVWSGFRVGPVQAGVDEMWVLPTVAPYRSRAEAPQPVGLVGANRSRRNGAGTEFSGIRPFQTGDRLRRINWRVSLRTGDLHVETVRAEEDSAVLLVVDALADHGRSEGVDGSASSLDVTVRAATALAAHFVRAGDRVGLRVVGGNGAVIGYAAGAGQLQRVQATLARIRPGQPASFDAERFRLHVVAGTVVVVLSPMLHEAVLTATATAVRRGLPVLVVDTLEDVRDAGGRSRTTQDGVDPRLTDLAWRMRMLDRAHLLTLLARTGCPVVPWRGPGTLDAVLHRVARRAQLPSRARR